MENQGQWRGIALLVGPQSPAAPKSSKKPSQMPSEDCYANQAVVSSVGQKQAQIKLSKPNLKEDLREEDQPVAGQSSPTERTAQEEE